MHGNIGTMNVMDTSGHLEIKWDSDNSDEVASAKAVFDEKIKAGYQAFNIKRMGGQGERMTAFNADAEKVMLVPQLKGG